MQGWEGEGQAIAKLYLIWARRARLQLISSSDPQKQESIGGINSKTNTVIELKTADLNM